MKERTPVEAHYDIRMPIVVFKDEEEKLWYAHCPVLDITGYGESEEDAEASFKIVLGETIEYMITHGTLAKELRRLGWKRAQGRQLILPDMSKLLQKKGNDELRRMMSLQHSLTYSLAPAFL